MSRKGDIGLTNVAVVLLILASALILFIFTVKLLGNVTSGGDRTACRSATAAQSIAIKLSNEAVKPECKTYGVRFYDSKVEINGKKISVFDPRKGVKVKEFSGLTDDIVNWVVAEELRLCWWQFLEGKKTIWSTSLSGALPLSPIECFICDEISFDSSVQGSFGGFYQFTKDTMMPDSEKTYYQYFAEEPRLSVSNFYKVNSSKYAWEKYTEGRTAIIFGRSRPEIKKDLTFETNNVYVVFFSREGEQFKGTTANVGDTSNLVETYFSYVMPAMSLNDQCTNVKRGE